MRYCEITINPDVSLIPLIESYDPFLNVHSDLLIPRSELLDQTCRYTDHNRIRRNVFRNNTSCADHRMLTNRYPGQDGYVGSNPGSLADRHLFEAGFKVLKNVMVRGRN